MGIEYDNIISFKALYNANRVAKRGKLNKNEVIEFQNNLGSNLWDMHYDLKYHRYKIINYHKFMIYDPKEREIQAISYKDRVIQHSLCDNYLIPLISKYLIYDNVACRKTKGSGLAIKRLKLFMSEYYKDNGINGYFIKLDIAKFFDSINHNILKDKLRLLVNDSEVLDLLYMIIDSYNKSDNKGIPMGNQTSQFFALYYLNELDHFIKERLHIKYYIRYMDDMILIVKDKIHAKYVLNKINDMVISLDLKLNYKSKILPIKNGVEFIG